MLRKVERHLGYGVRLVWVIDSKNRKVRVYAPDEPNGHMLTDTDTLAAEAILPGWSMPVKELFDAGSEG